MSKMIDFTGKKIGKLTVIGRAPNNHTTPSGYSTTYWLCRCDCGNEVIKNKGELEKNHCPSCGCVKKYHPSKHGLSHTAIHHKWLAMKKRCYNPRDIQYKNYGGRGIKICDEWLGKNGFQNFYNHVSKLPHFGEKGYSIDRIDVNGNYEPQNVRWATVEQQATNRRNTIYFKGIPLAEYCRKNNLKYRTMYGKLRGK